MKKKILAVLSLLVIFAMVAGCGNKYAYENASEPYVSSSSSNYKIEAAAGYAEEALVMDESDYDEGNSSASADILDNVSSQKLIKTVNLSLETTAFDELIFTIEKETTKCGGYIESSSQYGTEKEHSRNSFLVVRVPADQLETFEENLKGNATVTSRSSSAEDVTLQYSDISAHIESLRIEQETLNGLLSQATDLESIIALTERLSDVRYEIESYESQMKVLQSRISYSTLYIDVFEVSEITVQQEDSFGVKLSRAFSDGLKGFANGMGEFLIFIVGHIIGVIIFVIIIVVIVLVTKKLIKKSRENAKKEAALRMNQVPPVMKQPVQGGKNPAAPNVKGSENANK